MEETSPQPAPRATMAPGGEQTTLIGRKSKEEMARELAEAAKTPENQDMAAKLEGALEQHESSQLVEMTGKDLEFDVKAFLLQGVIRKENIKILDKYYIDMQSLTQSDRIVSETLVKSRFGNLPASDNVYAAALETAMITMAITRFNNRDFPLPTRKLSNTDPKAYDAALENKLQLFDVLLDANEKLLGFLSVLYTKLAVADILKEVKEGVDIGKKSEPLPSQESSGSSAKS